MTTTTDEYGKSNVYAKEAQMHMDEVQTELSTKTEQVFVEGERLNGRLAMLGITAALGAYIFTGQLIPGIY